METGHSLLRAMPTDCLGLNIMRDNNLALTKHFKSELAQNPINRPEPQGRISAPESDPLQPGYPFDAHLVAGLTPILEGGHLDFTIDRPNGMRGYILHLTTKGLGAVCQGEHQFEVAAGSLMLFPPSIPHYYQRSPDSSHWLHRWVYFRPRAYWLEWLHWQHQRQGVFVQKITDPEEFSTFENLFSQVESLSKSSSIYKEDLATNMLERLLLMSKERDSDKQHQHPDARVTKVCNYISENIDSELSIKELSEVACLSPSRLSHLFKQQTGMTLKAWRDDQRITLAKHLLMTTGMPIGNISRMLGYTDALYFSRVFRKKVGVSPSEYRT